MKQDNGISDGKVILDGEWWDSVQAELRDVVEGCNGITGAIAAHEYMGKYGTDELIEIIDRDVRQIRKIIEEIITPI